MLNMTIKPPSGFGSRPLLRLTGLLLLLAHALPLWAAPAQSPLINRAENKPRPNFVLTLDDSGSMTYQYMPEGVKSVVVGTRIETVSFPSDARVYMHPDEIDANMSWNEPDRSDIHHVAADVSSAPADAGTLLAQMQMRSPQINSIYYNPAVKYQPWVDAQGRSFAAATPARAYLSPLMLAPGFDPPTKAPAVNLTNTNASPTARWYCSTSAGAPTYLPCAATPKSYNPAIVYLLNAGQSPNFPLPTSYTLYDLNTTGNKTYPGAYTQRENDCTVSGTSTVCSQAAELDNYANWFVFYRSRLLLTQGAIPSAFSDVNDSIRLGWGTIHSGNFEVDSRAETIVQQGVRNLSTAHKGSFYDWLRNRPTYGRTPNRIALAGVGTYFQREDNGSPWSSDPGAGSATKLSCRRSYNILVTDGYYNDSYSAVGNVDASNNVAPYNVYPFRDDTSDTLADIAMKYWATDLQPNVANEVVKIDSTESPYKSDPATWQHLTQFTVGLGVTGTMPTTLAQLDRLALCGKTGGVCWSSNVIDDLWHAAVNSRGEYFSAKDSDTLTSSLQKALQLGSESIQKEAGVATAAPTLITNNIKFVPQYQPINWTGNILAYALNELGIASVELWNAESSLPAPDARNIFIRDAGAGSTVAFTKGNYTNFSADLISAMGSQASANLVDYLRGNYPADGVPRRNRKALLPDFVNSTPLFVKGGFDLGYVKLAADAVPAPAVAPDVGASKYLAYLKDKSERTNGALFIGGNGGMLHVFDETGVEKFGFVPYAGVGNLYKLARRDYGSAANFHQFFVDGPLVESDAYLKSGDTSSWTNVVVGTMGAGGRSVFALRLNTSTPATLNASSVLWEVNGPAGTSGGSDVGKNDIGYITSQPQVGMLPNGKWKVFVGNGLDSQSGRAALLVIDLESGAVDSVTVGSATANGLGGVSLIKSSTTNAVLGAYAGDATGKLWRFEYASSTGMMIAGYGGSPLMTSTDSQGAPQAITAAPVVRSHPNGGNIVVFGTGRLFSDTDSDTIQTQTLYGVWDKVKATETSTGAVPIPSGSSLRAADSLLVNQEITGFTVVNQVDAQGNPITVIDGSGNTVAKTDTFFQLKSKPVDWGTKKGWLLDLNMPVGGSVFDHPRVIDALQTLGESVYITALTPAPNAGETCGANQTAKGYAFLLKLLNGAQQVVPSFDTDGNSVINGNDIVSAGMSTPAGPQIIVRRESPLDFETGAGPDKVTRKCTAGSAQNAEGARDGQDCLDPSKITVSPLRVLDRTWRQLLNPPAP
ncbi:PilC/PilY family type IV pilus protein [Aquabacterium sp.]|uniref:pilus assembly protein n=1 Tax=Aquabacterium sp. TaxID=1872578 RepID=UPI00198B3AB8|nr:PilC/PilY family type IV pilus protein [Aquabacterium sp.]MBC7699653.1 hypothetical protein [Aquabacterium sp.]